MEKEPKFEFPQHKKEQDSKSVSPEKEVRQEQSFPYGENEESFGKWFREAAKDKWQKYLNGDERDITIEERDAMREFLIGQGTKEELSSKLDSFGFNTMAYETLLEEAESRNPTLKKEYDEMVAKMEEELEAEHAKKPQNPH